MADQLLPPWLKIARLRTDYLDNTGMTRALYTRAPETTGFGGDGLKLSLEFVPTSSRQTPVERAAIRTFLAKLRGRQNRAYLWDPSYRGPRGSFPASELLTNNTFANGTPGWSGNNATLSVADRVMRVTRNGSGNPELLLSVSGLVQYAPYALRSFIADGRGSAGLSVGRAMAAGVGVGTEVTDYSTARGLGTVSLVTRGTTADAQYPAVVNAAGLAGDFIDLSYTSLARCMLVDNGTNMLLQSDEFDTSWSLANATVDDQITAAPDGAVTADALEENTTSGFHTAEQVVVISSVTAEFSFGVAVKAGTRGFCFLQMSVADGVSAYFNLTTGAVSNQAVGASWSNLRTFSVDAGNGWWIFYVVARKTSAATSLTVAIGSAIAAGTGSYAGVNGDDAIYLWRATLAQSSVPTRLVQTTSAASTGTSQTGSALHLKGLRTPGEGAASGLLLPDDRFEIITSRGSELKIVTASLDSDAAGLGYLQFSPPLKGIPADNAPIIIVNPMTRAIFAGDMVGWDDSPGILTTASAEFEEA